MPSGMCSHDQRIGDRYCTTCGTPAVDRSASQPIGVGRSQGPDPGFDFEDTITIGDLGDRDGAGGSAHLGTGGGASSRRRDSIIGLIVLALLVGFVALMVTFSDSTVDNTAQEDSNEQDHNQPEPTSTSQPSRSLDPGLSSTSPPTPTPRPEFLDTIRDLDLGSGWLATINNDRFPVALNLETGEEVLLSERAPNFSDQLLFSAEGVHIRASGPDGGTTTWLGAWSSTADASAPKGVLPNGRFALGAFTDPDEGVVIVSLSEQFDQDGQYLATALASGASKPIPALVTAVDPYHGNSFYFGGSLTQPGQAAVWIANLDGQTWRWDWDDGWAKVVDGAPISWTAGSVITRHCAAPDDCAVSRTDLDGSRTERLPIEPVPGLWSFSPDQTKAVQVMHERDGTTVSIIDLATQQQLAVSPTNRGGPIPVWSPNSAYLIVSEYAGRVTVYDASTGKTAGAFRTQATISVSAAGPQPVAFLSDLTR